MNKTQFEAQISYLQQTLHCTRRKAIQLIGSTETDPKLIELLYRNSRKKGPQKFISTLEETEEYLSKMRAYRQIKFKPTISENDGWLKSREEIFKKGTSTVKTELPDSKTSLPNFLTERYSRSKEG